MNDDSHISEEYSEHIYCPSCAARILESPPQPGTFLRCNVCGTEFKFQPAQTPDAAIAESDRPATTAPPGGAPQPSPIRRLSAEEILLDRLKEEPPKKKPLPKSTLILLFAAIAAVSVGIVRLTSKPDIYAPGAASDSSLVIQKELFFQHIIDSLHTALVTNPEDTSLHLSLADAFYDEGKWMQSMKEFEVYLGEKPADADARVDYAYTIAQANGNLNDALAQIDTALKFKPDHLNALINAGIMTAQTVNDTNHATALARARNYFVRARSVAEKTDPGIAQRIDTLIQEIDNTGKRMAK